MKILIDIPEKTYQMIKSGFYDYGDMNLIIKNGKPLEYINAFINDIMYLWSNYDRPGFYFPEDLESDFFKIMKKWEGKEIKNEYYN